jgi:hypothetical protein
MSNENNDSDKENNGSSKPSITFEVFEAYHKVNPDLDNIEYYKQFPNVNTGTVRSWKARARKASSEPVDQTEATPSDHEPKDDKYLDEVIEIMKKTSRMNPKLLDGLDKNSQYRILKNAMDNQPADPNMKLYTPSGSGSQKMGIEKYMRIDEKAFKERGFGEVEIQIPASKLYNPDESKKLGKFN